MDEKRKGEIALIILKYRVSREGTRLEDLKKALIDVSKESDVPLPELEEFAKIFFQELIDEKLGKKED